MLFGQKGNLVILHVCKNMRNILKCLKLEFNYNLTFGTKNVKNKWLVGLVFVWGA